MLRLMKRSGARRWRPAAMLVAAIAGLATAALVGVALAKTFTLRVANNAKVTNTMGVTKHENIVVNSRGFAVYDLSGETTHHALCTKANGCFQFWLPAKVASAKKLSKAPGLNGKLGVWHRNGFFQVTLGGHPLYTFVPDSQRHVATGEGIQSFGGTWHVIKTSAAAKGMTTTKSTTTTNTTTTTISTTTTTTPCLYPPCS